MQGLKKLIICGAGGFGREVFSIAKETSSYGVDYVIEGFLDKNSNALDQYPGYPPVLSDEHNYQPSEDEIFIIAIANIQNKKSIIQVLQEKGASFYTVVHKSAQIADFAEIGQGCLIGRNVVISNDVKIGDFVIINTASILGHDTKVGHHCLINSDCFLGGEVTIAAEATIHTKSMILPSITIDERAVVGAGSVVIKDVKADQTVFGNPAKVIS